MRKGSRFLIIRNSKFTFECRMITELSHTGNDMIRSVFLQDTIKTNDYSKAAEQ